MTDQVIFELCERLGTTVNNLVPKVVEVGVLSATQGIMIGIGFLIVGLILLFIALRVIRDKESLCFIMLMIFGVVATGVGPIVITCYWWDLHLWKLAPDMMAYKELLSWVGGS